MLHDLLICFLGFAIASLAFALLEILRPYQAAADAKVLCGPFWLEINGTMNNFYVIVPLKPGVTYKMQTVQELAASECQRQMKVVLDAEQARLAGKNPKSSS